jgi:hypothetical protein
LRRRKMKRKQRVVLRTRRREKFKQHASVWLMRGGVAVLAAGVALGIIVQSDSLFSGFLRRHTPLVEIRAPQTLAGQPVALEWPARRYWLWVPGVALGAEHRLQKKNPAIRAVYFEKNLSTNRIIARIEPRVPLVRMESMGMDQEGVVFPILPGSWSQLPSAKFTPAPSRQALSRWIASFAKQKSFWSQVVAVSDDRLGNMAFDLRTGAHITWGPLDSKGITEKMTALSSVLEDAHQHLGGAALADLRFFEQGRIIVRPKSIK